MHTETQSAFASRMEVNRSTVSRWKDAGRLVMCDGQVDVEASMEMIQQTSGSRDDVARRHMLEREEKRLLEKESEESGSKPRDPDLEGMRAQLRAAALQKALGDARIKQAEADLREMERDQKAGDLMASEDVEYVLNDYGALLRVMLDGRAERLGAEQGFSPEQITGLAESDEQLLLELSEKLKARE